MMYLQYILVILAVAAAVYYLGKSVWDKFSTQKGCESDCGCSELKPKK